MRTRVPRSAPPSHAPPAPAAVARAVCAPAALGVLMLALAACAGGEPGVVDSSRVALEVPAVTSSVAAPHGGVLIELGDVAHVEFVLDSSRGILTAYVLDGTARNSLRLTQGRLDLRMLNLVEGIPEVFTILGGKPDAATGETFENTSVFIGFVPQLTGRGEFRALLQRVEVDGQVFTDVPVTYPPAERS